MTPAQWFASILVCIIILTLFSITLRGKKSNIQISAPNIDKSFLHTIVWAVSALGLVHWLIFWFMPSVWESWFDSKAFWFTIVSVSIAVILRLKLKGGIWYYVIIFALPISAIILQNQNGSQEKNVSIPDNRSEVSISDTTKNVVTSYKIVNFNGGENYEFVMPPNSEVVHESAGFKQVIRTDSNGNKTKENISGNSMQTPAGRAVITVTKGGPVTLKTWPD